MAKKELTEVELFKKDYTRLVNLNQKLKNISEGYYIGYDGFVYLKSLVPFVEKIICLHEPEKYKRFYGMMIMPNAFFDFTKKAKKTKLVYVETEKGIHLGQDDNEEMKHMLNIVNANEEHDTSYIHEMLIPKMYKRYFELSSDKYVKYNDKIMKTLSKDEIASLANAEPLFLDYNSTILTLTKQLLLDIKKDDEIFLYRDCYQVIDNNNKRVIYTIEQVNDLYHCCTIFNTLQS